MSLLKSIEEFFLQQQKQNQEIENLKNEVLRLPEIVDKKNTNTDKVKKLYTIKEAANVLSKSKYTVWQMCKEGRLKSVRLTNNGSYSISADALQKFIEK